MTTPTILDLGVDCLVSPTRVHVAVVQAAMQWPDNQGKRELFTLAVGAELSGFPEAMRQFEAEVMQAFTHGMIVGAMLRNAVGYQDIDPDRATMGKTKCAIASRFAADMSAPPASRRLSVKTIDNVIWPAFRSVAPYWAAYIHRARETGERIFPFRADDLVTFLAVAEAYRREGERVRSNAKAPSTVLQPGECLMPPLAIQRQLPQLGLEFWVA